MLDLIGARPASKARTAGPPADGLFAPDAVARTVHADFTSMMIGGVGALLLQMLHPSALAGVWDHTDFRGDMTGRLRRTARFVSVTTYGSRRDALEAISRVRSIHDRIHGLLPDGTPYRADDPELLTWVHVAEAYCFLQAFLRYRDANLSPGDRDLYFAEMAELAVLLGAEDVPDTVRGVDEYLGTMRSRLGWDRRTRRVASALLSQSAVTPTLRPFHAVVMDAGVDILPSWAAQMHGFERLPRERRAIRWSANGVGAVLRWAMSVDAAT